MAAGFWLTLNFVSDTALSLQILCTIGFASSFQEQSIKLSLIAIFLNMS
jgi:hypothetical protein